MKPLLEQVRVLVEFLNKADDRAELMDPHTAVAYGELMHTEGMQEAAEYVVLQVLKKATPEVRKMVRPTQGDLLKMWTNNAVKLVGTDPTEYMAIFEFPWRQVETDTELAAQLREFDQVVREGVQKGNRDAPSLAKRHLVLGIQQAGMGQTAQVVRCGDCGD